jgi:hypothetical protein
MGSEVRVLALLFVAAGLVASGWTGWQKLAEGHAGTMETRAAHEAAIELRDAGEQLYLTKEWADTYDGPDLKNFPGVQLMHADYDDFCIQVVKDAQVFRLTGPGGYPEPGRCVL